MLPPVSQSESSAFSLSSSSFHCSNYFCALSLQINSSSWKLQKRARQFFWNFRIHILAGIVIRAKYCWKRMKEITAENKFLAGVKNQCSVRKAGIGKPEQGVRQKSSKIFLCSATFQQKANSAGKSLFQRNIRRNEQALMFF